MCAVGGEDDVEIYYKKERNWKGKRWITSDDATVTPTYYKLQENIVTQFSAPMVIRPSGPVEICLSIRKF